ncbi:S1 family peptidase [Micromonospora phytophila]|uniref:S1 family peptidase n=1 Tax=Micromonospora phytophila TaxID=709888 RepID=UPI002030EF31|nr:S1 family peptidase [Micromonospora phytophila]MCM0678856.1 S1 family peptidase [Micromonospora phytophila]
MLVRSPRTHPARRISLAAALTFLLVVPTLATSSLTAAAAPSGPEVVSSDPQSTDNLDPALLREMRRQNDLEPALHVIWDEQLKTPQSGFAGVAYEGEGLSVYWKGDLTPGMRAALTRARNWGAVTVKPAAYSEAELHAAGEKIHKTIRRHRGSEVQSIGYKPDGSGLEVTRGPEVVDPRSAMDSRSVGRVKAPVAQILHEAAVTVPVTVVDAAEPLDLLASRLDDSPPWNGGGRWESWRGVDKRSTCTTGFGVHANGRSYVLSAGHCASPPDMAYQGTYGSSAFDEMGPIYDDDWRSDLLMINAPGWYLIFDGTTTTSNTKGVRSWGYWAAGQLVCQSGRSSGTVCGLKQVQSQGIEVSCTTPDSDGDCGYVIEGVIKTTQVDGSTAARAGDSGGPVFTLDGTGVRAKGILVGGGGTTMYFQDWADVIRVYGAYPNTNSSTS